jgi:hypothetical protein
VIPLTGHHRRPCEPWVPIIHSFGPSLAISERKLADEIGVAGRVRGLRMRGGECDRFFGCLGSVSFAGTVDGERSLRRGFITGVLDRPERASGLGAGYCHLRPVPRRGLLRGLRARDERVGCLGRRLADKRAHPPTSSGLTEAFGPSAAGQLRIAEPPGASRRRWCILKGWILYCVGSRRSTTSAASPAPANT